MTSRYKSKRRKQMLLSRGLLLVLAVIVVLLAKGVWGLLVKEKQTRERLSYVETEHEELEARNLFLEGAVARLSTDAGVEEEIRKQYGLGKEGERVFVIVDREDEEVASSTKGFWDYVLFWRD